MQALNPLPSGLQVDDRAGVLMVTRRWYSHSVWLTFIFCLIWNAFMLNWYSLAAKNPSPNDIALWFPVIHVGVGLWLIYSVLTTLVNRTIVQIGNGKFTVHHGPLPWVGGKTLETASIQQLFCDEVVRRGRGGTSFKYRLSAVLSNGQKEILVSTGLARDQALFLEPIAEKRLGIQPAPVVGELS